MGNNIRSSSRPKALAPRFLCRRWRTLDANLSVDRFCLLAGVDLPEMIAS